MSKDVKDILLEKELDVIISTLDATQDTKALRPLLVGFKELNVQIIDALKKRTVRLSYIKQILPLIYFLIKEILADKWQNRYKFMPLKALFI